MLEWTRGEFVKLYNDHLVSVTELSELYQNDGIITASYDVPERSPGVYSDHRK